MFQCRKDKGGYANIKFGWQTLLFVRQTRDLLPPAIKEPQSWQMQNEDDDKNTDTNTKTTQRHQSGQHRAPLLTIWAASKTKTKIWSSLVAFFISSLLILPFQVECTYVLLSSIRVNVFSFHVPCNHCSPSASWIRSAIQLQNLAGTSTSESQTNRTIT